MMSSYVRVWNQSGRAYQFKIHTFTTVEPMRTLISKRVTDPDVVAFTIDVKRREH